MGTIGSIVVNLEAQTAQFEKSITRSGESLGTLKEKGEGPFFRGLQEGLGFGAALEGIHLAIEGVEKLAEVGERAAEMVEETVKGVTATYRMAGTLHIPTESLMAFQNAAKAVGIDTETFNKSLEHLTREIGAAANGTGPASAGLKQLGLNAADLANMGADRAFEAIADKIADIPNPMSQATAAFELFGKQGQELLPLLQKGAAGLEHYKDEGREFGNTLNDIEAAKLVAVNDEFLKIGERVEGVKDRITVALAPTLLALADHILALVPPADQMKAAIVEALHGVGMAVGYVLDGWQLYKTGVLAVATGVSGYIAGIIEAVDEMAHALEGVINMIPGMHVAFTSGLDDIRDTALEMTRSLAQQTRDEWGKPWPHTQIDDAFKHMNAEADAAAAHIEGSKSKIASPIDESFSKTAEKVAATLAELKKQVDTFGMSEGDKKLFDLKAMGAGDADVAQAQKMVDTLQQLENTKKATEELKKLREQLDTFGMTAGQREIHSLEQITGVDPKIIEQAKAMQSQLDAMEGQKKLAEEGKRIFADVETPLEKYSARLDELNKALADGAINQDVYGRAVAKATDELGKQHAEKDRAHEHDKVSADVRRFDFRSLPAAHTQHPNNPQALLAKKADEHSKLLGQANYYLSETYRFQRDTYYQTGQATDVVNV